MPSVKKLAIGLMALLLALPVTGDIRDDLVRNGVAVLRQLGSDIFYAGLYLDTPASSVPAILTRERGAAMSMRIATRISPRRWSRLWSQGVAINASAEYFSAHADDFSALLKALRIDLQRGDRVVIALTPSGTALHLNGTPLIQGLSPEVFRLCLRSWIGPVPPASDFRRSLLEGQDDPDILATFDSLSPGPERRRQIATLVGKTPSSTGATQPEPAVGGQPERTGTDSETRSAGQGRSTTAEQTDKPSSGNSPTLSPEAMIVEVPRRSPIPSTAIKTAAQPAESAGRDDTMAFPDPDFRARALHPELATVTASPSKGDSETGHASSVDQSFSASTLIAQQRYINQVRHRVSAHIDYPLSAMRRRLEGSLRVALTVDPAGAVIDVQVVEQAGYPGFNREIVRAIEESAPFPGFPENMAKTPFTIDTPFTFKLAR